MMCVMRMLWCSGLLADRGEVGQVLAGQSEVEGAHGAGRGCEWGEPCAHAHMREVYAGRRHACMRACGQVSSPTSTHTPEQAPCWTSSTSSANRAGVHGHAQPEARQNSLTTGTPAYKAPNQQPGATRATKPLHPKPLRLALYPNLLHSPTWSVWAARVCRVRPVAASHTRTVLSLSTAIT